jgi:hypothetical protein
MIAAKASSSDRQLVDKIVTLATLASRREDIDPMMDTLRKVTSFWSDALPLNTSQLTELKSLEQKLKNYLIHEDPLRFFTPETLEKRVLEQTKNNAIPWINGFFASIVIALLAGSVMLVLPFALSVQHKIWLATFLAFVMLHIEIARFYITALKDFKSEFRQVYIYLSATAIVLSIAFAQYLIIELLELSRFAMFRYAGMAWLFSIAFILMYLGFRRYAHLLQIKTPFTSLGVAGGIALAAGVIVLLLPHHTVPDPFYFKISAVATGMLPVFALMSAALMKKIKEVVTPAYASSINWLYFYTLAVGVGSIFGQGAFHFLGELYGESSAIVMILFGITPQLVMLYASYVFKREIGK